VLTEHAENMQRMTAGLSARDRAGLERGLRTLLSNIRLSQM
jgi:hypothetical protein